MESNLFVFLKEIPQSTGANTRMFFGSAVSLYHIGNCSVSPSIKDQIKSVSVYKPQNKVVWKPMLKKVYHPFHKAKDRNHTGVIINS